MSIYDVEPLSLAKVSTYPLASRPSKVTVEDFATPITEEASLRHYLASLPNILAVQNLRELAARMRLARAQNKPIIWGIGGHVIKTGLGPIIIDLMNRGLVTAIAANGSVLVHDAEIAMVGSTSEDVDATLGEGVFGGAEETGKLLNDAASQGRSDSIGLGEAVGRALLKSKPHNENLSLLCASYKARVPLAAFPGQLFSQHRRTDGRFVLPQPAVRLRGQQRGSRARLAHGRRQPLQRVQHRTVTTLCRELLELAEERRFFRQRRVRHHQANAYSLNDRILASSSSTSSNFTEPTRNHGDVVPSRRHRSSKCSMASSSVSTPPSSLKS